VLAHSNYDIGGEFNAGSPIPPSGRDKSSPYARGIASLAVFGQFATNIILPEELAKALGRLGQLGHG